MPGMGRTAYPTYLFQGLADLSMGVAWPRREVMTFGGNPVAIGQPICPASTVADRPRGRHRPGARPVLEAERGLLTLTGTGGSGKTSLALAVVRDLLKRWNSPRGVAGRVAPLGDASRARRLAPALASRHRGRSIRDTLLDEVRLRTLLVVLDNCEHQVETCAALADDLLRTCPGVRILATSREPLRVHGERVWRVPPLPTPDPSVTVGARSWRRTPPCGCRAASASRSAHVRSQGG